jgi:sperm-associated antigen 16 protein
MDPNGPGPKKATVVALETVEISDDSDDDFEYAAVDVPSDDEGDNGSDDDVDATLAALKRQARVSGTKATSSSVGGGAGAKKKETAETTSHAVTVDDFIRNFLLSAGLHRALDAFNTEWYEQKARGLIADADPAAVPDLYARNAHLEEEVIKLREELARQQEVAAKAHATWDKFRKERDYHKMHHQRVVQEKNRLIADIKRLKKQYESYEPTMKEMRIKYELSMKEKMLMRLERDRVAAKVVSLESQVKAFEDAAKRAQEGDKASGASRVSKPRKGVDSRLPSDDAVNPHLGKSYPPAPVSTFGLARTFKAHSAPVSGVAFHPTNSVVATVSDDMTWKLWTVPGGELVLSGGGHRDWIAGVDFHPSGAMLATSSGDGLVKLWDFASASCTATFSDHTQAAWGVAFHHGGDFLVSCSMDHTCKLWDLNR